MGKKQLNIAAFRASVNKAWGEIILAEYDHGMGLLPEKERDDLQEALNKLCNLSEFLYKLEKEEA